MLLPLAGGAGAYYLLTLYNKGKSDLPADPQSILKLSSGSNYFSYEEQKQNYLRRLLGVGTGLAGGKLIYQALAGHFASSTGRAAESGVVLINERALPPPDPKSKYIELKLPKVSKPKTKSLQRYTSMFRRPFRKSDFAVIMGALLSYYAIEKATYFALQNMDRNAYKSATQRCYLQIA